MPILYMEEGSWLVNNFYMGNNNRIYVYSEMVMSHTYFIIYINSCVFCLCFTVNVNKKMYTRVMEKQMTYQRTKINFHFKSKQWFDPQRSLSSRIQWRGQYRPPFHEFIIRTALCSVRLSWSLTHWLRRLVSLRMQ